MNLCTAERGSFENLSEADLASQVMQSSHGQNRNRRLLAPADSVNALTVGGLYDDSATYVGGAGQRAVFASRNLPAPYGAQGFGFRQSLKPDMVVPSGRVLYQEKWGGEPTCQISANNSLRAPGQLVALAPRNGQQAYTGYIAGTSNAAALTTRAGLRAWNVIDELRRVEGYAIDGKYDAVLIKALLGHACRRAAIENEIRALNCFPPDEVEKISRRLTGYGKLYDDFVASCTEQRATLIAFGSLVKDEAHEYDVPTPPSLYPTTEFRRATITLAYFTPINIRHHLYRRAVVRLNITDPYSELGVRIDETQQHDSARGTLQHVTFAGRNAVAGRDGRINFSVNCRAEAGELLDSIAYGIAVTIEAEAESRIPVYQEVRAKVFAASAVPIRANAPSSARADRNA